MRYLLGALLLLTAGCDDGKDCWKDQDGLTWTNKRLMQSFEHRRDQIGGDLLCYPNSGLVSKQLKRGKPCPHPRQRIAVEGGLWVCRCSPKPDVLFSSEDIARWCTP